MIACPRGPRFGCCVGGWRYADPYGYVTCAGHEEIAKKNKKPSKYFINWFLTWQP